MSFLRKLFGTSEAKEPPTLNAPDPVTTPVDEGGTAVRQAAIVASHQQSASMPLEFVPASTLSVEGRLKHGASGANVIVDWDALLSQRPFDRPFYTAFNNRATILVRVSSGSINNPRIIQATLEAGRPWLLNISAFVGGAYPILRCVLGIPDNPADPLLLESPLDLREGDAQAFCQALLADEAIDMVLQHEYQRGDLFMVAVGAAGLAASLRREVEQVLQRLPSTTGEDEFQLAVRQMEAMFPHVAKSLDRAKSVWLAIKGPPKNEVLSF